MFNNNNHHITVDHTCLIGICLNTFHRLDMQIRYHWFMHHIFDFYMHMYAKNTFKWTTTICIWTYLQSVTLFSIADYIYKYIWHSELFFVQFKVLVILVIGLCSLTKYYVQEKHQEIRKLRTKEPSNVPMAVSLSSLLLSASNAPYAHSDKLFWVGK